MEKKIICLQKFTKEDAFMILSHAREVVARVMLDLCSDSFQIHECSDTLVGLDKCLLLVDGACEELF